MDVVAMDTVVRLEAIAAGPASQKDSARMLKRAAGARILVGARILAGVRILAVLPEPVGEDTPACIAGALLEPENGAAGAAVFGTKELSFLLSIIPPFFSK